ncbi:MAG: DUF3127 domain-containing protein [Candidatus Absconditabacteria bacterium]|nr:DUF3127 domain-containing protein [Candidatus Absconditabacteria bacterium]MDD3868009.1 DUF3127 domain-containing protein [Candidatus Absconditabacteria bacterium]MDD4714256.1 DUF3127 domain-containing protein [Candidatus Absconditabacteria bacterium]
MTIEGKIIFISEETIVGQKQLPKISFVIEENSDREFKNSLMIDLLGDKSDMIKSFKEGDAVRVFLNYRAREYDGRWFNSIGAWKIESMGGSSASSNDDLPF